MIFMLGMNPRDRAPMLSHDVCMIGGWLDGPLVGGEVGLLPEGRVEEKENVGIVDTGRICSFRISRADQILGRTRAADISRCIIREGQVQFSKVAAQFGSTDANRKLPFLFFFRFGII